ncbi:MAG: segregation/condensation protein A [Nitrospirae bacterium]|nr:segregation/condensation protein A [Nitrospirota bacterium]
MSYEIKLDMFEGPLDLLLYLIRKNEVNIYDIPIALITQQYLEYIDLMKSLNLDIAGEFLVMAATLIHIKSKMLLPPTETDEDEEGEDPRAELVRRLSEYKKFKDAAMLLEEKENLWRDVFRREGSVEEYGAPEAEPLLFDFSLFDLVDALKSVIERLPEKGAIEFAAEELSVKDRMNVILERLENIESLLFAELFDNDKTRMAIVATFLALLELVKLRLVRIQQVKEFDVIRIFKGEGVDLDG